MKALLRKKSSVKPDAPAPQPPARPPPPMPTVETPLYARFARIIHESPSNARPVVSGPMPLGKAPTQAELEERRRRNTQRDSQTRRAASIDEPAAASRRAGAGPEGTVRSQAAVRDGQTRRAASSDEPAAAARRIGAGLEGTIPSQASVRGSPFSQASQLPSKDASLPSGVRLVSQTKPSYPTSPPRLNQELPSLPATLPSPPTSPVLSPRAKPTTLPSMRPSPRNLDTSTHSARSPSAPIPIRAPETPQRRPSTNPQTTSPSHRLLGRLTNSPIPNGAGADQQARSSGSSAHLFTPTRPLPQPTPSHDAHTAPNSPVAASSYPADHRRASKLVKSSPRPENHDDAAGTRRAHLLTPPQSSDGHTRAGTWDELDMSTNTRKVQGPPSESAPQPQAPPVRRGPLIFQQQQQQRQEDQPPFTAQASSSLRKSSSVNGFDRASNAWKGGPDAVNEAHTHPAPMTARSPSRNGTIASASAPARPAETFIDSFGSADPFASMQNGAERVTLAPSPRPPTRESAKDLEDASSRRTPNHRSGSSKGTDTDVLATGMGLSSSPPPVVHERDANSHSPPRLRKTSHRSVAPSAQEGGRPARLGALSVKDAGLPPAVHTSARRAVDNMLAPSPPSKKNSATQHRPITPDSPGSRPSALAPPAEIVPAQAGPRLATMERGEGSTPPPLARLEEPSRAPVITTITSEDNLHTPPASDGPSVSDEFSGRAVPETDAELPPPVMVGEKPRRLHTPPSPEDYSRARAQRRGKGLEKAVPEAVVDVAHQTLPTVFYPLIRHLQEPDLLAGLLSFLTFYDWLVLWSVNKENTYALQHKRYLREVVLERFLGPVGYTRWRPDAPEVLPLSLKELHAYMRGVGMPTHTYAQIANQLMFGGPQESGPELQKRMKKVTRAYSRVVLRLRAQAEAEAEAVGAARRAMTSASTERVGRHHNQGPPPAWSSGAASHSPRRMASRQSSRAPSPTNSAWSHSNAHGMSSTDHGHSSAPSSRFTSPLFRPRRAPLLRVFVPSLEGDWLSDAAIVECENELKKAGVAQLLRPGDVVWDVAVGDEGNIGRLLWDGRYLIDLDYTYSPIGDLPPALPTLAFPPSYFHRVVRIAGDKNPICHIDVSFWAAEIAANLQLLQDRVKTETPQGSYHTVVRWVHRSSFTIRHIHPPNAPVLSLPSKEQRTVDPGWYGTVVVEAEGTNEGLADLQQRCKGGFPPRATPGHALNKGARESTVWRILRERSRPGEIWIRAVSYKERLAP